MVHDYDHDYDYEHDGLMVCLDTFVRLNPEWAANRLRAETGKLEALEKENAELTTQLAAADVTIGLVKEWAEKVGDLSTGANCVPWKWTGEFLPLMEILSAHDEPLTPIQSEAFHTTVTGGRINQTTEPITIYVRKDDLDKLKGSVQVHFEGASDAGE